MKICIPSMDNNGLFSEISVHFGKSPYFTILDVKDNKIEEIEVIESEGRHAGGKKTLAEIIIQSKPDVLLCANLGSKALQMFNKEDIKIYVGASGNVKNTFEEWKNDNLKRADETMVCKDGN
ncbi:NifB/NifX family molybdenum-iron cluster-binding protein [Methanobacterium spitsbergense]|uniref:NifB/NifX family molybdenum-iron cluster-binding protein n=1 Tax=Methanobacterium spitsbergense TaxID=2874285 RepID=A0A8T5UX35_9EURY|nr:NifB/NifX family molybdenum-iron cluster-binding protein [Methanobacterium spitsbergense]MBZ2166466.1 NifB/NifX family molybdenum-iron cluster-binding protein [Methanobacterium spitsbergense]